MSEVHAVYVVVVVVLLLVVHAGELESAQEKKTRYINTLPGVLVIGERVITVTVTAPLYIHTHEHALTSTSHLEKLSAKHF